MIIDYLINNKGVRFNGTEATHIINGSIMIPIDDKSIEEFKQAHTAKIKTRGKRK